MDFDVSTAPADSAVHVHVAINPNSLEKFERVTEQSNVLLWVATGVAVEMHPNAHLMFTQINMGIEWQGQFDY